MHFPHNIIEFLKVFPQRLDIPIDIIRKLLMQLLLKLKIKTHLCDRI